MKKTFSVLLMVLLASMLIVSCDNKADEPVSRVGEKGEAGIIFYDKGSYSDGWRYLEADTADLSGSFKYGEKNTDYNAKGDSIGDGKTNTDKLVANQGSNGSYAAVACSNLERTVGEKKYDDWFLPSSGEFVEMVKVKDKLNLDGQYWTSTEKNDEQGGVYGSENTNGTGAYSYAKDSTNYKVRAVRAF